MNEGFKNILQELTRLNLPENEYAIFGSGPMAIRGVRETQDLDIVVTDELYEKLLTKHPEKKKGVIEIGDIEIYPCWNAIMDSPEEVVARADLIGGYKFIRLEDLIAWKKKMARPKDFEHIKMIENYLKDKG